MKIKIFQIKSEATYAIRHEVLRKGKPFESSFFEGDNLKSTMHFGIHTDNYLFGILSLFKNSNTLFNYKNQYQLRGMAILESFQRNGYGQQLIERAEEISKQHNTDIIWLNAREKAVTFYEKLGYEVFGKPFDIVNIGLHYVMFKKLE